jgi:hypothetical protein
MKKTPEQIVHDIQEACKELGWHISMNESSNVIKGLIIGDYDYIEGVVEQLSEMDDYSIYSSDESTDPTLQ